MPYQVRRVSSDQDRVLRSIVERARGAGSGVAVFDLDGCLFDNRHRELHMLRVWAEQHQEWRLLDLRVEHFVDWQLDHALLQMGLSEIESRRLADRIQPFWRRWFFDGDYIENDRALPGATRMVQAVWQAGLHVVYLTGRGHVQADATGRHLARYGFPWGGDRVTLATKRPGIEDVTHKREVLLELDPVHLLLDNEPANVNLATELHPDALVVWLMTDHSPRPITPDDSLPRIYGYLRTDEMQ